MENAIALREWAVAVKALEAGRQIIVLRKGGISEETKEFRLESHEFYLFPSFEHQRPHLVKPEASALIGETQAEAESASGQARITSYAEVVEDIEVTDSETLKRLEDLHIWTEDYAEERLKWKKTKPLHVLVLRVFKFDEAQEIPMLESYGGCKSWLTIEDVSSASMTPVLNDNDFEKMVADVKRRIAG
ncbi:DUF1802 family protein [Cohnella suwonensis]|uniref:DUF1802 family protein n=1 Tax=Cohnella suwonensis TaxID=696072 RepID=A0ABW0LUT9_9BACL